MVIETELEINGRKFISRKSDSNLMIKKAGTEEIYEEAIDPIEYKDERIYEETDIIIEDERVCEEHDSAIEAPKDPKIENPKEISEEK